MSSDITRSEAIKTLKEHLSHWERLLQEHICEEQEGIDTISALKLAIASLETDEAYQLEYESTTKNDLGVDWDELKRKILMEVDGGTGDKWLRYADVCDRISDSIDEYIADMREVEDE